MTPPEAGSSAPTAAHAAPAVVTLDHVSYRYGRDGAGAGSFLALRDVSLTIKRGEFIAVTGTSGSGKTTLMNLLGSLATTTEGSLKLGEGGGVDPATLGEDGLAALRHEMLGFIFQQFHLLPRLTVLENVLLPATYSPPSARDALEARARALLARLGIGDQAEKLPATLSGGQKQRVAIARALLMDPAILLADEPTGALDSRTSKEVLRIFAELNAEGRTVIIITHDPEVAACARRRLDMRDGQVVLDAAQPVKTPDEILPDPAPVASPAAAHPARSRLRQALRRKAAPLFDAWRALFASRLRTALTSLGLVIGVASITIMITLGTAAQDVILGIFAQAGTDRIYVGLDYRAARSTGQGYWRGLDVRTELAALQNAFADKGRIVPLGDSFTQNAFAGGNAFEVRIQTLYSVHDFVDKGMKIDRGRMLAPHELADGSRVALVGTDFADTLWPQAYEGRRKNRDFPLGERFTLRGTLETSVTVVGIVKRRDTTFESTDINSRVYVPMAMAARLTGNDRVTWMAVVPAAGVPHRWMADAVVNYLRLLTGLKYPFRAHVPEELINRIMVFIKVFQGLTALIGGLCILVGGIGIMNIMLVTIAERVKEIGLRKAVGASADAIRRQFLAECTLLCTASGVAGTLAGSLFCNAIAFIGHAAIPDTIPGRLLLNPVGLAAGLLTAIVCGFAFGMMPAVKAARLDPSEALRSE